MDKIAQTISAEQMLSDLEVLVNAESPSRDIERLNIHAALLASIMTRVTGIAPTIVESDVGPHLHWVGGPNARVLILGHHDTVHPAGTTTQRPFKVSNGHATGPGVFDMKAGIVQAIHALGSLADISAVEMLITADEEIGSRHSRELLQQRALHAGAVLVLEPSADGGALKIGRKGTGNFELSLQGKASHAGLEPEKGVNALLALSELLPRVVAIARPEAGTTVTPTIASAGTADNVVPASATCMLDVRVKTPSEKVRVETEMRELTSNYKGATLLVTGGMNRPPMHSSSATDLFAIAQQVAHEMQMPDIVGVEVGGGSDGNFTAAVGVQTLDGLGAVGGGAHADSEHVVVATMVPRAMLLAGVIQRLSSMDKRPPLPSVPADR
ncbi:MAG: M20 family metallopeptidase [Actinobacteria bacterium]|nr:M20 family metallopeptidase [Actinomycetota bacterium]